MTIIEDLLFHLNKLEILGLIDKFPNDSKRQDLFEVLSNETIYTSSNHPKTVEILMSKYLRNIHVDDYELMEIILQILIHDIGLSSEQTQSIMHELNLFGRNSEFGDDTYTMNEILQEVQNQTILIEQGLTDPANAYLHLLDYFLGFARLSSML